MQAMRDEVHVIDSDGHVRDLDELIKPYLPEPYCRRRMPYIPREVYDRSLGGTLGQSGVKHEERLAAMDRQEIQMAGVYPTPGGGMLPAQGHSKNRGSPEFYPLYEEAQRLGVPLAIHAFGGDEAGSEIFEQFICIHTTGHPFPVLRQLTAMIFGGIPELFPKLKLGYLEIGCGWIPYWSERMDEEWEKRGKIEAPLCKKKPSEYLTSGRIYYGCEPEEKMMGYIVREIGSETLMYASDYPHWDASWPESAILVWKREDLSLEAKKNILENNARRFYNLS